MASDPIILWPRAIRIRRHSTFRTILSICDGRFNMRKDDLILRANGRTATLNAFMHFSGCQSTHC